jgi:hypothetical protein
LTATTFSAATFRYYEQRITDETTSDDKKKDQPIKLILTESFGNPSLLTLHRLTRHCYHLIDDKAPSEIHTLREAFSARPVLGAVGDLLDDLERVFTPPRVRIINKSQLKKPILDYIFPEFARYDGRLADLSDPLTGSALKQTDSVKWQTALLLVMEWFSSFRTVSFRSAQLTLSSRAQQPYISTLIVRDLQ